MKKNLLTISVIVLCLWLAACGGGKESAKSIAQKWCDLNAKVHKAADGPAKDAAEMARKEFENKMDAKYKGDEAFEKALRIEVEKCEGASEGK